MNYTDMKSTQNLNMRVQGKKVISDRLNVKIEQRQLHHHLKERLL